MTAPIAGVEDARAAFERALDQVGSDDRAAEAGLEALALREPEGEFTDEALIEAAQLCEEKLARPDRARDLYAKLLALRPDSRHALRARARLAFLDGNLRTGVAPLAEYQAILNGFAGRPSSESAARMDALLSAHPDFALADKAGLWLAGLSAREGRLDEAERRYAEVERRFPDGPARRLAERGQAELLLLRGRPFAAVRALDALLDAAPAQPSGGPLPPELVEAVRATRKAARIAARRLVLYDLSLGCLAAYFAAAAIAFARARRDRRTLRPPTELYYYLPVAALFSAAGLRERGAIAQATLFLSLGGAALVWAGALLSAPREAAPPSTLVTRARGAIARASAALSLAYAAFYASGLTDFVVETLRSGPDR